MVIFKDIIGFPGYKVGDDGSVWGNLKSGRNIHREWRRMSPGRLEWGHLYVNLRYGGKTYNRKVHRLVLEAFVGPRPIGMECCHKDGNPANNTLSNLRWDTKKSNAEDKKRHGTDPRGTRNGAAKLNEEKVRRIRRLLRRGRYGDKAKIARMFGIHHVTVVDIESRRIWAWLE